MSTTVWMAIGVAVVVVFWAAAVHNRLRQLRNRVDNAFAQIDVQLKRRHDLIPNLVEVARGYMAHESSTLEAVARARGQAAQAAAHARRHPGQAAAMASLAGAEAALGSSLGQLMVLTESYPDLKADAQMQSLSEEITSTENRLGFARQAYNDEILAYNDQASQFPDLLIARLIGFAHLDMLQATESAQERAAPQVRF
ncbi:LemA family protein [Comamonas denitrificans]|jgi:LemA protein|uniref:LemA family protein n=1 Tax=Comamonas denitrificans TaxID=117506 RepID=A0A939KEE2_9BURK|nr:LemA family protein [Comamonas denitrificans]MBP8711432.1 LemA family protein [Comamonas sp.]MBO1249318.1 LemA family protein [Comamonas denitrificans]MBS7244734.1 LemA family protein [Comamonas sp.]HRF21652.1 LemA family protein [Comamonas denitrificans]HRL39107.1 LemA family protein [Comamonas denitrificans]